MPSAKFNEVYEKTRQITSGPSNDEQLDLYGYAKIATGQDINDSKKPGMFDVTGKAKRGRWQKFVDEGVSAEDAEKKYIALGEQLISKYLK